MTASTQQKNAALQGIAILVTRAVHQADSLVEAIRERGGKAILFPTIEIVPPDSWQECDRAIASLYMYDGLVFTSANAVSYFFNRMDELGQGIASLSSKQVLAVGEKTKGIIEGRGTKVSLVPDKFSSTELSQLLSTEDLQGKSFLFLQGNLSKEFLPEQLKKLGAAVDAIQFYQTRQPRKENVEQIRNILGSGGVDVLTFTSPSTFENFVHLLSSDFVKELQQRTKTAVIGPTTANAVRELGFRVDIEPETSTIEELLDAVGNYFAEKSKVLS